MWAMFPSRAKMEFQQIQRYGISLSKRRCFKISYCMKNLLCMVWPATCFFRSCEKNHKEFAGGGVVQTAY